MKIVRNFNICIKLAELRTKIKNSPQPQVRNLNCQSPQVRMSATFFVSPQLFSLVRNCGFVSISVVCKYISKSVVSISVILGSFVSPE